MFHLRSQPTLPRRVPTSSSRTTWACPPISARSDRPIRPGGCSWRKITSRLGPLRARRRRSKVQRTLWQSQDAAGTAPRKSRPRGRQGRPPASHDLVLPHPGKRVGTPPRTRRLPVRLRRAGCSCQFGRASAPMMPRRCTSCAAVPAAPSLVAAGNRGKRRSGAVCPMVIPAKVWRGRPVHLSPVRRLFVGSVGGSDAKCCSPSCRWVGRTPPQVADSPKRRTSGCATRSWGHGTGILDPSEHD
jgi:hypothetical protein